MVYSQAHIQSKVKVHCFLCSVSTAFGKFSEDFVSPGSGALLNSLVWGSAPASEGNAASQWQNVSTPELHNRNHRVKESKWGPVYLNVTAASLESSEKQTNFELLSVLLQRLSTLPRIVPPETPRPINDRKGFDLEVVSTGCRCLLTGNNKDKQICSSEIRGTARGINGCLILNDFKICLYRHGKNETALWARKWEQSDDGPLHTHQETSLSAQKNDTW